MSIICTRINERLRNGVLSFFKTYDWNVEFLDESVFETDDFDEDTQSMISKKTSFYAVFLNDELLFEFDLTYSLDLEMNKYRAVDIVRKDILENNSYYLGDYYFEYILTQMMDSLDLDSDEIEDKLTELGVTDIEVQDGDEDRECDSVTWNDRYLFNYKNKKYSLYVSGTAIAEISYERWVDTFGYNLTDWDLDII